MSDMRIVKIALLIIVCFVALVVVVGIKTDSPDHVETTPVTEYQLTEEMQELRTSVDALVEKMLEYEQAKKEARGE